MSNYVILVRAPAACLHAISLAVDVNRGIESLSYYSPIPLELVHSIRAANRSDLLLRTLEIKYRDRHRHGFWYALTMIDVAYIRSLTETNFQEQIGFIHHALKKPEHTPEQLREQARALLARAEGVLIT